MIDYGAKGCRCFRDEVDVSLGEDGSVTRALGRWLPNAACPHHGLLADYTERKDTGVYTVIRSEPGPEAVSWPCDEGEDLRTGSAYTHGPCPPECGANPMDCPGPDADRCLSPTTEQERQRGLRAAVRRAWNRVGRAVYGDAWPYWF